jgi:signal transduction histidine kinase
MSADAAKICERPNRLPLNAVTFTSDGGSIILSARRRDNGVAIDVADTGSGIDSERMPRMPKHFFTGCFQNQVGRGPTFVFQLSDASAVGELAVVSAKE